MVIGSCVFLLSLQDGGSECTFNILYEHLVGAAVALFPGMLYLPHRLSYVISGLARRGWCLLVWLGGVYGR